MGFQLRLKFNEVKRQNSSSSLLDGGGDNNTVKLVEQSNTKLFCETTLGFLLDGAKVSLYTVFFWNYWSLVSAGRNPP